MSGIKSSELRGLASLLLLKVGSIVMANNNLCVELGISNGSRGTVLAILYEEGVSPPSLPAFVVVRFASYRGDRSFCPELYGDKAIAVRPYVGMKIRGQGLKNFEREEIPLTLCWGFTIHKSQGTTMESMKADLGPTEGAAQASYVQLSRVKELAGLILVSFEFSRLKKINAKWDEAFLARCKEERRDFELFLKTASKYPGRAANRFEYSTDTGILTGYRADTGTPVEFPSPSPYIPWLLDANNFSWKPKIVTRKSRNKKRKNMTEPNSAPRANEQAPCCTPRQHTSRVPRLPAPPPPPHTSVARANASSPGVLRQHLAFTPPHLVMRNTSRSVPAPPPPKIRRTHVVQMNREATVRFNVQQLPRSAGATHVSRPSFASRISLLNTTQRNVAITPPLSGRWHFGRAAPPPPPPPPPPRKRKATEVLSNLTSTRGRLMRNTVHRFATSSQSVLVSPSHFNTAPSTRNRLSQQHMSFNSARS